MSYTKSIPGFWNGISQQAPAMRRENQAARQVNAYGTLVNGLEKRRGTNHLAVLGTLSSAAAYVNCLGWIFDLGAQGVFLVLGTEDINDPIQVYTLDGVKKTVNYATVGGWSAKNYFAGTAKVNRRLRAVVIGTKMFLLNTEITTAINSTAPTIIEKTVVSYDAGADTITITNHGYLNGDRIQYTYNQGAEQPIAPLKGDMMYYVVNRSTNTFQLSLTRGGPAIDLIGSGGGGKFRTGSILAGTVQTFADLPLPDQIPSPVKGDVYRIQGSDTSRAKWYVRWNGAVWEEHYNIEEADHAPDGKTMPMSLTYDGSTFTIAPETWPGRTAGDTESNPPPSFSGKTINNLFFHRGRFGLLSGNNVILSQAGADGHRNFFPTSVVDVLDDDPIDIGVSADNLDILRSTKTHANTLLVFGDKTQFAIHSGESSILSPTTVASDPTTFFEIEPYHQPFAAGSNILFLCETPQFLNVREYFVNADTLVSDAADITIHVPRLIPRGDGQIVGINVLDVAFVHTRANPDTLYVYKYYWVNDEKIQSAWSEWTFDGAIRAIVSYAKSLYMVVQRDDEVSLESMDVEGGLDPLLGIHIHMDRATTPQVSYNSQTGKTTFVLPYTPVDDSRLHFVSTNKGDIIFPHDMVKVGNTYVVQGDQSESTWRAGVTYEMEYELSEFFLRNEQGTVIQAGRIALRRLWLEYSHTGYFMVSVQAQGRDERVDTVVSIEGNFDVITHFNTINTISGADKFPVFLNSKVAIVTIKNPTVLPCKIVAGAWEYLFTPRVRPVG